MFKSYKSLVLNAFAASVLVAANADAFEAQNLALLRVGDGVLPLSSAGYNSAPMFEPVTELLPNTPNSALRGLAFTPTSNDALYKNGFEEN